MDLLELALLHFLLSPVFLGVAILSSWKRVLATHTGAVTIAIYAVVPSTIATAMVADSLDSSSLGVVALFVAATLPSVFLVCMLRTNRLTVLIQFACIVLLAFLAMPLAFAGVGILLLWSTLLMVVSMAFLSKEITGLGPPNSPSSRQYAA